MAKEPKPRGLICEAYYSGAKFKKWDGKDKDNPGRMKVFRTLTHRFFWETPDGDECLNVTEWLPDDSTAVCLSDCQVPYVKGSAYNIGLRGLKEEGGILQASYRIIKPLVETESAGQSASPEKPLK